MKTKKARLDTDGKAIPKTKIVAHVPFGHCVHGGNIGDSLELRAVDGETIPLTGEKAK